MTRDPRTTPASLPAIIRTRIAPPRPPADAVRRPALEERLRAGLAHRLTAVVAAAGYGKSAALSMVLAGLPVPVAWLRCDAALADDPSLLVAHLAYALAVVLPGVGLRGTSSSVPEDDVGELCDALLASSPRDLVIVLDDAESLRGGAAAGIPALLAERLPAGIHLAVASRSELVPLIGEPYTVPATELGEEDLALDGDEAEELLRTRAPHMSASRARALGAETEGWLAGLLLGSRRGPAAGAALAGGRVAAYLEREVLGRLDEADRDLMMRASLLERVTPAAAEAVTGRADAGRALATLHAEHAFVFADGAGAPAFRLHRLLRRFLRERLEEGGDDAVRELHRRAAQAWLAAGEPLRAAYHHLHRGDAGAAANALEGIAETTVTGPRAQELADTLDRLPAEVVAGRPPLLLARAVRAAARGGGAEAVTLVSGARARLQATGERERAGVAAFWLLRAIGAAAPGVPGAADAAVRALGGVNGRTASGRAARVVCACLLAREARFDEAEGWLEAARTGAGDGSDLVDAYGRAIRAAMIDHPQGRSEGALEILEGVVSRLDREERADALAFLPEVRARRALVLSHLGQHEEALAESARLTAVAGRRGLGALVADAVDDVRLEALASLGRWPELAAAIGPAVDPAGDGPDPASRPRRHLARARLCASRGEGVAAVRHLRAAADAARRDGAPFECALLLADIGLVAIGAGDERLAHAVATQARDVARAAGAPWARCRAAMVMAASAGDGAAARAAVDEALELSTRWSLVTLWTRREPDLAAQLLPWAVAEGIGPDGVAARLARSCGGRVTARCAEGLRDAALEPSWRFPIGLGSAGSSMRDADLPGFVTLAGGPDEGRPAGVRLRILSLGRFSVLRDGPPPTRVDFQRMKARAVLAFLLSDPDPVARERLIEAFWPHLPVRRATAALNSTMHTLRHALDPVLVRGAGSSCIRFAGNAYSISLREDDEWDALEFMTLARRGLGAEGDGAVNLLRVADAAYTGPFLPEWPEAEWARRRREEIDLAHRRVLEALGGRLLHTRRVREAVEVLRRLVAFAPDHEAAHRALMTAHLQAGERGLALRQYDQCVARLRTLGVRPSPETQAIHDSLLSPPPLVGWVT